jgi:hypothetical protein
MSVDIKLKCYFLAGLSSLVECLRVRMGPTRVNAPGLTRKQWTKLERLATDKHSSLLGTFIKSFLEFKLVKFCVSRIHWSYPHIIVPAAFAGQGGSIRKLQRLDGTRAPTKVPYFMCWTNSKCDHLCPQEKFYNIWSISMTPRCDLPTGQMSGTVVAFKWSPRTFAEWEWPEK